MLDLERASRDIALPSPIHFQRRAARWVARRRAEAGHIVPAAIGPATLDPLDLLRSLLNIRNGHALERVALARAIETRHHPILIKHPDPQIVGAVARAMPHPITRLWGGAHEAASQAKRRLYKHRVRLELRARPTPARGPRRAAVLAVPSHPGHLFDLLPIAERVDLCFATPLLDLAATIEAAGRVVHRYGIGEDRSLVDLGARRLRKRLTELLATARDAEVDALEHAEMIRTTTEVLDNRFDDLGALARGFGAVFDATRPKVVLIGNPYTLEGRVAARVSKALGATVAAMEHGSIFPDDPIWQECPADHVYAWGEPSRRALESCGVRDIRVLGAPRMDAVVNRAEGTRDSILIATSGPGDQVSEPQHRAFAAILLEACRAAPEIRFVAKLHRKDDPRFYEGRSPNLVLERGEASREGRDIFDYLARARAMITVVSSTANDAMLVDVPVITVDVRRGAEGLSGIEFIDRGATRHVADSAGLVAAAREAWAGERWQRIDRAARAYAREHYVNPGAAAGAIAEDLARIVEAKGG